MLCHNMLMVTQFHQSIFLSSRINVLYNLLQTIIWPFINKVINAMLYRPTSLVIVVFLSLYPNRRVRKSGVKKMSPAFSSGTIGLKTPRDKEQLFVNY